MPNDADGSPVSESDALAVWTPIARDELIATARSYQAVITYKELALLVQERSGISTRKLIMNWIGGLLEQVAAGAAAAGEPPLTSLCVRADGTIGDGYIGAPRSTPLDSALDPDAQAAFDRLLCYRAFASDLPSDGGAPALTPQVADKRARERQRLGPREVECPSCHFWVRPGPTCIECGAALD